MLSFAIKLRECAAMESDNSDDDYLSRLLAFMWRFRLLCAAIILAGAIIGPFRHRQTFPLRTTLSLRLVSPSVGYKHGDFWAASGKAWLTELTTVAAKSSTPQLQISVLTARDPWQLTVVALHSATEGVEGTLLQVVEKAGQLLHPGEGPAEIFDPKFVTPVRAAKDSRGLMAELRYHLTELEKLLGNSSGGSRDQCRCPRITLRSLSRAICLRYRFKAFRIIHGMSGFMCKRVGILRMPYLPGKRGRWALRRSEQSPVIWSERQF